MSTPPLITDAPVDQVDLDDVSGESAGNDFLLEKHGLSAGHVAGRGRRALVDQVPAAWKESLR